MKVLAITNVPVPYRVDFFNELSKNVELTVIYEQSIEQQSHRDRNWFTETKTNYRSVSILKENNKLSYKTLFSEINKAKNDIILMMGYSNPSARAAIAWMKLRGIPYMLTCDGAFRKNENKIKYLVKKFFISGAVLYLSTGKPLDDFFVYYGAEEKRIRRIPFTTLFQKDIIPFPVSEEEKKRIKGLIGINEDKVILSVGQFIYRKGYDVLLEACKELDPYVGVYIVGGQATDEYIEMKEKNHLDHVHFIGFKTKEELKKFYMASDLFVLPTREDIWGLVINEAMAYGLPIITTNKCLAGLVLIEEGKNGRIINTDDATGLRKAIESIINDNELLSVMSINSLKAIQAYSIENMANQHYQFFKDYEAEKTEK